MIETTAIVSAHSPNLIDSAGDLPQEPLQRYWSCSKARQRRWTRSLEMETKALLSVAPGEAAPVWDRIHSLLIDVFSGELITRVWGGVLAACKRSAAAQAIAGNVLVGHLEIRRQALQVLLQGSSVTLELMAQIDRLRRRSERWTDLLLGHLVRRYGVKEFAFDTDRSLDFGEEQLSSTGAGASRMWGLYLLSLRPAFPDSPPVDEVEAGLRREIINSMLACFPENSFQEDGPMRSVWLHRIVCGNRSDQEVAYSGIFKSANVDDTRQGRIRCD